ncbi:hypothetical protein NQZ68_031929 [Dissostichus eleginoides]|nr:hypothetical protein NQZ68_031929 [Dissostichus eleginoides]
MAAPEDQRENLQTSWRSCELLMKHGGHDGASLPLSSHPDAPVTLEQGHVTLLKQILSTTTGCLQTWWRTEKLLTTSARKSVPIGKMRTSLVAALRRESRRNERRKVAPKDKGE